MPLRMLQPGLIVTGLIFAVVMNYLATAIILIASPPPLISQATARYVIDPSSGVLWHSR